jgi:5-methylcytosine-specific restriction endonuclease McrA
MASRLTTLKPKLSTLAPRIGRLPNDEKARLRERDQNVAWRDWYGTARWKKLRKAVWVRDLFVCQKTGVICTGTYPAANSPTADHIVPHRGDPELFWDMNNLQTVSKGYHDSEKQRQERYGQW